jgi:hypothetical protein
VHAAAHELVGTKKKSQRKQRARKGPTKANFVPYPTRPDQPTFATGATLFVRSVRGPSNPTDPVQPAAVGSPETSSRDIPQGACVPRQRSGGCRTQSSGRATEEEAWPGGRAHAPDKRQTPSRAHAAGRSLSLSLTARQGQIAHLFCSSRLLAARLLPA